MASKWYVVRTEPRAEYLATKEFSRDGIETYLPTVNRTNPRVGHTNSPLFPGYLFLRYDPDVSGWPAFRPGHRILGLVNFGQEVPSVPDEAITELKNRLDGLNSGAGLWRRFYPGETVRIVSDSVEGLAQVVEESKSPEARVNVLLSFMGRMVSAQVPWDNLRPVQDLPQRIRQQPRRTRGGRRWIQGFGPRGTSPSQI